MNKFFGKEKNEETQKVNPEDGSNTNEGNVQTGTSELLNSPAMQAILQTQHEEQKRSIYFSLPMGTEAKVRILPERTQSFKTKLRDGSLGTKFMYYLYQDGIPDVVKQFEVWAGTSAQIIAELEKGNAEMIVQCVPKRNDPTKTNYRIKSLDETE